MLAPSTLILQMGKPRLREAHWVSLRHRVFLPAHAQVLESEAQRGLEQETWPVEDGSGHGEEVAPTRSPPLGFCSQPM